MIIRDERSQAPGERKGDRVYDPDILPQASVAARNPG